MLSPIFNDEAVWGKINACLPKAILFQYDISAKALAVLLSMVTDYNKYYFIDIDKNDWSAKLSYEDIANDLDISKSAAQKIIAQLLKYKLIQKIDIKRSGKRKTEYCLNVTLLSKTLKRYIQQHEKKQK